MSPESSRDTAAKPHKRGRSFALEIGPHTRRRVDRAKAAHRTDVADWKAHKHFEKWASDKHILLKRHESAELPRVDFSELSSRTRDEPFVITNGMKNWDAMKWTFEHFRSNLGATRVKVGESDDGKTLKLRVKEFLRYMYVDSRTDDSPLYVFDSGLAKRVALSYSTPFRKDLFADFVKESRRPPHAWVLLGPERSGSTVHVDPLSSSAWNALIVGRKLWVFLDKSLSKENVKLSKFKIDDDEARDYFCDMLPKRPEALKVKFYVQIPGEIMHVPPNCWHAVLNLDDTIAITENFADPVHLDQIWRSVRKSRSKMAYQMYSRMTPDLVRRVDELNEIDGWRLIERRFRKT